MIVLINSTISSRKRTYFSVEIARVLHAFFGHENILHVVFRNIPPQACETRGLAPLELALRRKEKVQVYSQRVGMRRVSQIDQAPVARGDVSPFFQNCRAADALAATRAQ